MRKRGNVPTFRPDGGPCGYLQAEKYATDPSCDYQERIRNGQERVTQHYTTVFDDRTTSR